MKTAINRIVGCIAGFRFAQPTDSVFFKIRGYGLSIFKHLQIRIQFFRTIWTHTMAELSF